MMNSKRRIPFIYLCFSLLLCLHSSPTQSAQVQESIDIDIVSVSSNGTLGNSHSGAFPFISSSGRFVVFESTATNLVTTDTNGVSDIFVHDRTSGNTTRVSVASEGTQANNHSYCPCSISSNGRFVAFESTASNLVLKDTNNTFDIFVHDRDSNNNGIFDEAGGIRTFQVSIASDGTQGNAISTSVSMSPDGRYVAFMSESSNLVPGQPVPASFVHDRDADVDNIFDEPNAVITSYAPGGFPKITANGRYVAVRYNGISVYDRLTSQLTLLSVAPDGTPANDNCWSVSISADGRYVAFSSHASNLVVGDTNFCGDSIASCKDIFVRDRDADSNGVFDEPGTSITTRVSVASDGTQSNYNSDEPALSADGQFVVFNSQATNLVIGDNNGFGDIFIHNLSAHTTNRISTAFDGSPTNSFSQTPSISSDGRDISFQSPASNLINGGGGNIAHIFVRTLPPPPLPSKTYLPWILRK